eukprot:1186834-Prorocentrum_minimum.AAC.11
MHLTTVRFLVGKRCSSNRVETSLQKSPVAKCAPPIATSRHGTAAVCLAPRESASTFSRQNRTRSPIKSDSFRCRAIADDAPPPVEVVISADETKDAASVVLGYFDAFNRRDMDAAIQFISPECVFEDLGVYPEKLPPQGSKILA